MKGKIHLDIKIRGIKGQFITVIEITTKNQPACKHLQLYNYKTFERFCSIKRQWVKAKLLNEGQDFNSGLPEKSESINIIS